jgi:hypothetical protein
MNNIAIIYHDADFDGKLSNEVCRFHLKRLHPDANIHSYGWDYGRPVPVPLHAWFDPQLGDQFSNEWSLYDAIYIVDLSVDELMARPELRDKIVWIDHHKSAIEKWDASTPTPQPNELFQGIRIDGVAACRLCWAWFTWDVGQEHLGPLIKSVFVDREIKEPRLIRLAGEYDIWDHRDTDAKVLQFGLRALSETDLGRLVENQFSGEPTGVKLDDVITQGRAIKAYCDKQNDEYSAAYSHTIGFEGLTFCALNIGQRGNSDLLKGGIRPEHDACFAWRYTGKDNRVMVSLYHIAGKEHHDLSKIAVKYGGGGHKGACGFRITLRELEEIVA